MIKTLFYLFCAAATLHCFFQQCNALEEESIVVDLPFGKIRGYSSNASCWQFFGIPFAKPPIGELRWKEPVDFEPFNDHILDAKKPKPVCPQDCDVVPIPGQCKDEISEDCLYLNVFVPKSWKPGSSQTYSVVLFLFGGGYVVGSAGDQIYHGRFFTESTNTIMVTINNRLGALGYLANSVLGLEGNMGFKDQRKALEWVTKYISYFGGKGKTTLLGESMGAFAVSTHLSSTNSRPLFGQTIIMSSPWMIQLKTKEEAQTIGQEFFMRIGCASMDCLNKKNWKEIIEAQTKVKGSILFTGGDILKSVLAWGPNIDGIELTNQPYDYILNSLGAPNAIQSTIVGTTTDEGFTFIKQLFDHNNLFNVMYALYGSEMEGLVNLYNEVFGYPTDYVERFSKIFGDYLINCPNRHLARQIATSFSGKPDLKVFAYLWGAGAVLGPDSWLHRPVHGSDLPYIFDTAHLLGYTFSKRERSIVNQLQNYLGNMVKTGNPNGDNSDLMDLHTPFWSQYDKQNDTLIFFEIPSSYQISDYAKTFQVCDYIDRRIGYSRVPKDLFCQQTGDAPKLFEDSFFKRRII